MPELRTLLKQKLITFSRKQASDEIFSLKTLEKIRDTYFVESKVRVIRRFIHASKLMRLVHLIYAFVALALNLEREFCFENALGLTEQPSTKLEDIKHLFVSSTPRPVAEKQPEV